MSRRCGHETEGKYKPNGEKKQCQCTMCHAGCFMDRTIYQCGENRSEFSNLFCVSCEELHGDAYRAKYGKEGSQ